MNIDDMIRNENILQNKIMVYAGRSILSILNNLTKSNASQKQHHQLSNDVLLDSCENTVISRCLALALNDSLIESHVVELHHLRLVDDLVSQSQ